MNSAQLLSSAWLAGLVHVATADIEPFLSYDIRTIKTCSYWYDNYGQRTCESIRESWLVSPEDFARWNPSLTVDCQGWAEHAYCVAVLAERTSTSTTTTSTTTTTTTSTSVSPAWTDRGCYKDASRPPFQTKLASPTGKDFTRLKCKDGCWDVGYKYVGFKAGAECWCGQYVNGDMSSSSTDCSLPCAGNSSEICGGDGFFNVVEGNKPAFTPTSNSTSTTSTSTSTTSTSTSTTSTSTSTTFTSTSSTSVSSLDTASLGSCPDGEVQISYWQNAGCSGDWYGYGYSSRHPCRQLWSGGANFKSLWLRCAKSENECVNKKTCTMSPEPSHGLCSGQQPGNDVSFKLKSHYHTDSTGDQHNDVAIKQNTDGMCMNLDCQVGSLDIDSAGNCPKGQVQISYWQNSDCSGQWYGYGYGNRGTCRGLWKDGYKTKSVWLRCAEQSQDCVSKGSCKADPEPSSNLC